MLALARKRICIYDEDLVQLHFDNPARIALLKKALSVEQHDCLRVALRNAGPLQQHQPLFRDLLKVTGVGARIALAILSGISVDGFVRCVQARDTAALTRVPGVGRKTAERLILDLRERVEEMAAAGLGAAVAPADPPAARAEAEVVDALQALGYRPVEARRLVEQAQAAGATTTADILRAALRAAAPGGRS